MHKRRMTFVWRMRLMGIFCGASIAWAVVTLAQGLSSTEGQHLTWRDLMQFLGLPAVVIMIGLIGWFGRDAYGRLKAEVDQIRNDVRTIRDQWPDRFVKRDDWREEWRHFRDDWADFKKEQADRLIRLDAKLDAKADRIQNNGA